MSGSQAADQTANWYDPNMYAPGNMGAINQGIGPDKGQSSNGYTGSVNNLKDFLSAIAMGVGTTFGGLPGVITGLGNIIVGANTGTPPSTPNTLKQAYGGLKNLFNGTSGGPGGLASGNIDLTPGVGAGGTGTGNLAGLAGGIGGLSGNMSDITGQGPNGNSMSGSDLVGGDRGDRTAEARNGYATGGAIGDALSAEPRRFVSQGALEQAIQMGLIR